VRLHEIKAPEGARKERRRVGRGHGSGRGKTAGRGTKGQKARTGDRIPLHFEGGQTPITMRVGLKRGEGRYMRPRPLVRPEYEIVNVMQLNRFEAGTVVTPGLLIEQGMIDSQGKKGTLVKILGEGELTRPLTVQAHKFSASARERILAAGGSIAILAKPWRPDLPPIFAEEPTQQGSAEVTGAGAVE
jgi:large subunit ribosomal protein L15